MRRNGKRISVCKKKYIYIYTQKKHYEKQLEGLRANIDYSSGSNQITRVTFINDKCDSRVLNVIQISITAESSQNPNQIEGRPLTVWLEAEQTTSSIIFQVFPIFLFFLISKPRQNHIRETFRVFCRQIHHAFPTSGAHSAGQGDKISKWRVLNNCLLGCYGELGWILWQLLRNELGAVIQCC